MEKKREHVEEIAATPLRAIMHTDFERVHPDTPLADIYRLFAVRGRTDVIIIDDDRHFVGMITDLDLLSGISPGVGVRSRRKLGCVECMIRSRATRAGEIMTRGHITLPDTVSIEKAMVSMEKNRHPDVVVVDEAGVAVGVVEMCDIITYFIEKGLI
ncbi:MAG: CBS domain-containing protein [Methanomicrobiaceae archaeon]|nr:CBS domain-containing protein [Methanomicrobiaceae archaeon]